MNNDKIHPKAEKSKREAVNNPLLMSLPKAAQKLEVSTRTVRRLSQLGTLPQIVKVGNCARISWQGQGQGGKNLLRQISMQPYAPSYYA